MASSTDIAIVGMSALFPGAGDARTLWRNIVDKVSAVSDAPEGWVADDQFDPQSRRNDQVYTKRGGFLHGLTLFDPLDAGIMPSLLDSGDPDHYLAVKLAADALRDAGYEKREFNRERTGVFVGRGTFVNRGYGGAFQHAIMIPHCLRLLKKISPQLTDDQLEVLKNELKASLPAFNGESVPSIVPNIVAGRIANRLDLMGPNFILDAACSSSLFAIELAMKELRSGNCDMMLAGGINAPMSLPLYVLFCQIQALSRTSSITPFADDADGTLLAEGLGFVALKRADDAVRDGDRIYAVIKEIGTSSDGKAMGLLTPRSEGQVAAMQRAYETSGIAPETIELLEAHGTGIRLGDETEVGSVKQVFGGERTAGLPHLAMGSVKSMIGHAIPAAGMASLVKTAMALYQKVLPPTLCEKVNPDLKLEQSPIYINNQTRPWIHAGKTPRRAAISTFGFGGINAHAILEETPGAQADESLQPWASELFLFSGSDRQGLLRQIEELQGYLSAHPGAALKDVSFATCERNVRGEKQRLALLAGDRDELIERVANAIQQLQSDKPRFRPKDKTHYAPEKSEGKTAFIFSGQGTQYADMLADLCMIFPSVRRWFDLLDRIYLEMGRDEVPSRIIFPAPTCLTEDERKGADAAFFTIETGANVVLIASIALFELLVQFGIPCDAIAGHSTGESTAIIASGALGELSEELVGNLIKSSACLYKKPSGEELIDSGAMLSIGAIAQERLDSLLQESKGKVLLALDNCPNQKLLFGQEADLKKLRASIEREGGLCDLMPFGYAIHTSLASAMREAFSEAFEALPFFARKYELYSCISADTFPEEEEPFKHQASLLYDHTVRFHDMVVRMYEDGFRNFVDVGPRGNSISFIRDSLTGKPHMTVASNSHLRSGIEQLLQLLAEFYVRGFDPELSPLFRGRGVTQTDMSAGSKPSREVPLKFELPLAEVSDELARSLNSPVSGGIDVALEQQKAEMLKAHFGVMNEFLASQERMLDMIGRLSTETDANETELAAASRMDRFPLIGEIIRSEPGMFTARRSVTLDREIYLVDHAFGSNPSIRQPELTALPVIPFTMSMEASAEAAMMLAGDPNGFVAELYDIRALRWLALDDDRLELRIEARDMPSDPATEGRIFLVRIFATEPNGTAYMAFETKVRVDSNYSQTPGNKTVDMSAGLRNRYTPETLYNDGSPREPECPGEFHGPRFRAVKRILRIAETGIEAELEMMPVNRFIAGSSAPGFLLDPVMIDASMHLSAYWMTEKFDVDVNFLPFRAGSYQQFAPSPETGEMIVATARVGFARTGGGLLPEDAGYRFLDSEGEEIVRARLDEPGHFTAPENFSAITLWPDDLVVESSVDFTDRNGHLFASMTGRQDRHFPMPRNFDQFTLYPNYRMLSVQSQEEPPGNILLKVPEVYLHNSGGILLRRLARLALNANERKQWLKIPGMEGQTDWLMRRIVAKELVRLWLAATEQLQYASIDISIAESGAGVFSATLFDGEMDGLIPEVAVTETETGYLATMNDNGADE